MIFKQGERLINARNWSELVKPEQVTRTSNASDRLYGKFVCEPLERGYGTTIGNALRRILLSSLQGAACVSVKVSGVQHEFTTISGVLEDVTDIVLNVKQVRFAMDTDEPQRLTLSVSQAGAVTAANIACTSHVVVLTQSNICSRLQPPLSCKLSSKCVWARAMSLLIHMKVCPMKSV